MLIHEITDMLRREARRLDDEAMAYTQEGILMREAAAKLEELQRRKGMQNAESRIDNPSVSFADSSLYTREPIMGPPRVRRDNLSQPLSPMRRKAADADVTPLSTKTGDVFGEEDEQGSGVSLSDRKTIASGLCEDEEERRTMRRAEQNYNRRKDGTNAGTEEHAERY